MELLQLWKDINDTVDMPKSVQTKIEFCVDPECGCDIGVEVDWVFKLDTQRISVITTKFTTIEQLWRSVQKDKTIPKLFDKYDIPYNKGTFAVFIILHEVGHVYTVRSTQRRKLRKIYRESNRLEKKLNHLWRNIDKCDALYREIPTEKLADDFAVTYTKKYLKAKSQL